MTTKSRRSTAAVIVTSLYLLAVVVSLVIMVLTVDDTAMSGIFLVLVTMPWSFALMWLQDTMALPGNAMFLQASLLTVGGLFNGFILYKIISFITCRFKR